MQFSFQYYMYLLYINAKEMNEPHVTKTKSAKSNVTKMNWAIVKKCQMTIIVIIK